MQAILFDIDGVIYQRGAIIDGAAETLKWLRQQQIPYLFVSNSTTLSRDQISARLNASDIPCSSEQILTPAVAARDWIAAHPGKKWRCLFRMRFVMNLMT